MQRENNQLRQPAPLTACHRYRTCICVRCWLPPDATPGPRYCSAMYPRAVLLCCVFDLCRRRTSSCVSRFCTSNAFCGGSAVASDAVLGATAHRRAAARSRAELWGDHAATSPAAARRCTPLEALSCQLCGLIKLTACCRVLKVLLIPLCWQR